MKYIILALVLVIQSSVFVIGQWSSSPISLPSGALILKIAGTCPQGTIQNTSMSGKVLIATTIAAGNAGTAGGNIVPINANNPVNPAFIRVVVCVVD